MSRIGLTEVAIIIRPERDNLAVVLAEELAAGTELEHGGELITLAARLKRGQSFAIKAVAKGQAYISLGDPVGVASRDVGPGEIIDAGNLENRLPRLRVRYRDNRVATAPDRALSSLPFQGYIRSNGSVGVRNFVGVVASGMCSASEARAITNRAMRETYSRDKYPNVDGVIAVAHESGCGMPNGGAVGMVNQLLANVLRHPNFGALLYIDLGCGKTCLECSLPIFETVVPDFAQRVATLSIQQAGGGGRAVVRSLDITERLLHHANQFARQPVPISKLIVGTECGGSDRWSGVTANPAVGVAADMLVKGGAAVLLSEIPELQGAALVDLVRRARSRAVGRKLVRALKWFEQYARRLGEDFRENPSPGNVEGGLFNIFVKSSGAKAKGGTSIVEDFLEYGEWLGDRRGLYVLNTPGYDPISVPALFLSGAQLVLFTTGRGSGLGCAMGPVVKIASNPELARNNEDIDINAGTILERQETIEEVGRRIFQETLEVASGRKLTRAEESGFHTEFKIWESLWPSL